MTRIILAPSGETTPTWTWIGYTREDLLRGLEQAKRNLDSLNEFNEMSSLAFDAIQFVINQRDAEEFTDSEGEGDPDEYDGL